LSSFTYAYGHIDKLIKYIIILEDNIYKQVIMP